MKKILLGNVLLTVCIFAGVVEQIHESNKLRIGIKYDTKPFGFKEGRKIKGLDLDLAKLVVVEIKKREKLPKLKVFYKKVYPSNREKMLLNKEVDMIIATYTITDERKKTVTFSRPYFTDDSVVVYRKDFIKDHPVGVLKGSTMMTSLKEQKYTLKVFENYETLFKSFSVQEIDAMASDRHILERYIDKKGYKISRLSEKVEYAIGLPKDDKNFELLINDILNDLIRIGKIKALSEAWQVD